MHADAILADRRRRVQNGIGVAARRGVTSFFQCVMYVCKLVGAVTANKRCMLYITVSRACELHQYVTPLQGNKVMIGP